MFDVFLRAFTLQDTFQEDSLGQASGHALNVQFSTCNAFAIARLHYQDYCTQMVVVATPEMIPLSQVPLGGRQRGLGSRNHHHGGQA